MIYIMCRDSESSQYDGTITMDTVQSLVVRLAPKAAGNGVMSSSRGLASRQAYREVDRVMRIEHEIFPSDRSRDEWIVEAIDYDRDGQVYVTIFSGPWAEERAREYVSLIADLDLLANL
ncbi:hypothetical protein LCGC14_0310480 [marine sediment metagenome]|uniref:Uncharacterized protein n=1 Tax=marine sediment metagenome TaxID=412755 RepID=A0A0F9TM45_9ZZZZ